MHRVTGRCLAAVLTAMGMMAPALSGQTTPTRTPEQIQAWAADRSADGGKTWVKNFQQLEVRRIGPARSMAPLTSVRASASGR